MRRIARDRCGYEGYSCVGAEVRLTDAFASSAMTCDPAADSGAARLSADSTLIDNYLNLPVDIAGFTMKEQSVVDLSAVRRPDNADELCYTGLSIVGTDGGNTGDDYIDMYNYYNRNSTIVTGDDAGTQLDLVRYYATQPDDILSVIDTCKFGEGLLCFAGDTMMTPAIMEPVIPVNLPQIETSTTPETLVLAADIVPDMEASIDIDNMLVDAIIDLAHDFTALTEELETLKHLVLQLQDLDTVHFDVKPAVTEALSDILSNLGDGVLGICNGKLCIKPTAPCPDT